MANPMGDTATAAGVDEGEPSQERPVPRVIAVDGSAASGKSTVGRRLAAHLGYPFLDTGIMYRAFAYAALKRGVGLSDDEGLGAMAASLQMDVGLPRPSSDGAATVAVDGEDVTGKLRTRAVEEIVSLVSRVPAVREALVRKQREIAARREPDGPYGIVMAGRDIGTVVLPGADLKIYLDASLEERAARRHREFARLGRDVSEADVLEDIRRRDQIDSERAVSPLRPADDAVIVETDGLTLDQVMEKVHALVEAR